MKASHLSGQMKSVFIPAQIDNIQDVLDNFSKARVTMAR